MVVLNKQEKMFSSDRTGFLCILKICSSRHEGLKLSSKETGFPRAGYLSSQRPRAKAHKVKVLGQIPRKVSTLEALKKPEPHL